VPQFSFLDRVSLSKFGVVFGHENQLLVMLVKHLDFGFGKILDIDQPITGSLYGSDDLVKLQMYRRRIFVLRSLNQKNLGCRILLSSSRHAVDDRDADQTENAYADPPLRHVQQVGADRQADNKYGVAGDVNPE
jgi:hypothetical protein